MRRGIIVTLYELAPRPPVHNRCDTSAAPTAAGAAAEHCWKDAIKQLFSTRRVARRLSPSARRQRRHRDEMICHDLAAASGLCATPRECLSAAYVRLRLKTAVSKPRKRHGHIATLPRKAVASSSSPHNQHRWPWAGRISKYHAEHRLQSDDASRVESISLRATYDNISGHGHHRPACLQQHWSPQIFTDCHTLAARIDAT